MNISFEYDPQQNRLVAAYLRVKRAKVHRTVEIEKGACYADEDRKGELIGVEILAPGLIETQVQKVQRQYGIRGLQAAMNRVKEAFAA